MNDIVVNDPYRDESDEDNKLDSNEKKLAAWVVNHVTEWTDYRDEHHGKRWDEYYRLWRGIWSGNDKTRKSERSKLISPAMQQAIDSAVSEIDEAMFGKGRWYDIATDDDAQDEGDGEERDPATTKAYRIEMLKRFKKSGITGELSKAVFVGALYGTGLFKLYPESKTEKMITRTEFGAGVKSVETLLVQGEAVMPYHFVIDPSAKTIEEALGVAQTMVKPKHTVMEKQRSGAYRDVDIGTYHADNSLLDKEFSDLHDNTTDRAHIIEYQGLVPRSYLDIDVEEGEEFENVLGEEVPDDVDPEDDLVEALVTVVNLGAVVKAKRNPNMMEDRGFLSFQFDTVLDQFWGRGVAEKGYNSQKALDAELRARMDGLALTIHPMMGVDVTKMPKGSNISIAPGKSIGTVGDPNTILRPFNFGNIDPTSFSQSADFERMVGMATGTFDGSAPGNAGVAGGTLGGTSMIVGSFIKRNNRVLRNIGRDLVTPFIKKASWRFMQFDPENFPPADLDFKIVSTLGIMARELEQQQLSSLLNTVPPDSPAYWMLIRSIYENSSISNREEMIPLVDQLLQRTLNPPEPQPTFSDQLKAREMMLKAKNEGDRVKVEFIRAKAEVGRLELAAQKAVTEKAKDEARAMLDIAKAEAEELGQQINQYKSLFDLLEQEQAQRFEGVKFGNTDAGSNAGTNLGTDPQAGGGI